MIDFKPLLPCSFTGVDIETKSVQLNAYILSFGIATIDMRKFTINMVSSIELDPEDETAKTLFHECPQTMAWWNDNDPTNTYAPSALSREVTWGGTVKHIDGIHLLNRVLSEQNALNTVFTSRGPEFDMRIIEQSCIAYGINHRLRYSNMDSDRTHERHRLAMGIDAASIDELRKWKIGREGKPHMANFDAASEAYNGARQLWLSAIASLEGREGLLKALEAFANGTFDPAPYLDRVEFTECRKK